jgi:hypothetical protein
MFHNSGDNLDSHSLELNKNPRDRYKEEVTLSFIEELLLYKCRKTPSQSRSNIMLNNQVNNYNLVD